jgi:biopolymer transport protein ExbD
MPLTKARLRIEQYNEKRKRDLAGKERRLRIVNLSLTSMVDMFAILVIFLLTCTTTSSQWLEVGHGIELPKAKFAEPPQKALILQVSKEEVFGENKPIISLKKLLEGPLSSEPIRTWLASQAKREGNINILGHEHVPFGAMKRVIASCQDAGFSNVILAVQPK